MINSNQDVNMKRLFYKACEKSSEEWPEKWGWILDEFGELRKELALHTSQPVTTDKRRVLLPRTTNGLYGWLSTKQEFSLKLFGADVRPMPEIPEIYGLKIDQFPDIHLRK